jgi:PTS system glucitol/sorbitol-specific IIA component
MKVIYENQVKACGIAVEEFRDAGMFIIFGDNAPEEIKDYCYSVSVNPINGEIKAGQYLQVDDKEYRITAVGYEAPVILKGLGHCTINFSGATEVELPGTIYVEHKNMPILGVGTVIRIVEK